jgi:pyridoxine 5-phosphate synthase
MNKQRLRLGLNIDHVATVRNARGGSAPDPLRAAEVAIGCHVDGITAHLREDRRHILDDDMRALKQLCEARHVPLNFEMAVTLEMMDIVVNTAPHAACLVPERRVERTTEGGLDVVGQLTVIQNAVSRLRDHTIRASLFIATEPEQIKAAAAARAPVVEFHTGALCDALREGEDEYYQFELKKLREACQMAGDFGIEVHAGHGIDYDSVLDIALIPQIKELNIGHFLIGEAIFVGLETAILKMRELMDRARSL